MQIHELSRRRTNEGIFDTLKGISAAGATALGKATGVTTPNAPAKSAGIIDPATKLAAVRKNKDMQRVAAQLATGWAAQAPTKAPAAAPAAGATPLPEAVGTYNKKTGAANLDGKTMTSLSDLPPAIQQQIQAKQQAAATPTATPAATPPKPGAPPGFNATNIMKMPGMPGQPAVPGTGTNPTPTNPIGYAAATPAAATPAAATPPGNPATAKYLKDFLAYVNQKTAIRDASTYQMIGLNQIIYQSGLKAELDNAKAKVLAAYEAGQDVTKAAADYILIAMAGAQLIMSKNKAGVGPTPAGDVAPADGAAPAAAPAPTEFLSTADVQGLFNLNGVDNLVLTKLGTALQQASGTNTVNRTGNGTVDNLLRTLGFKVK
jgi:hypothetical protein